MKRRIPKVGKYNWKKYTKTSKKQSMAFVDFLLKQQPRLDDAIWESYKDRLRISRAEFK